MLRIAFLELAFFEQLCFRFLDQQGQCGLGINSQNSGSLTGPYDQGQMSKSMPIPTSQGILQPFHGFTYVTAHSPTFLSILLRHRLFTYVTWRAAHEIAKWNKILNYIFNNYVIMEHANVCRNWNESKNLLCKNCSGKERVENSGDLSVLSISMGI